MRDKNVAILLIEDNPGDTELLRELLPDVAGLAFGLACADTLAGGVDRLAQGGIDIVLLDLDLPDSTGLATVDRVRAAAPHVPIVVLTGLDDAQSGVQAVKRGAQDYLVKGRVDTSLLVHCMGFCIERHRLVQQLGAAIRELEASQGRLEAIIDADADAVFVVETDNTVRFVNPAGEKLAGLDADLLVGAPFPFGFHLPASGTVEVEVCRPNGEVGLGEVRVATTQWAGQRARVVSIRDVTRWKQHEQALERSEQHYRCITEALTDYIFTVNVAADRAATLTHGPRCAAMTGYTPEEFAEDPRLWLRVVHEDDRPIVLAQAAQILAGQRPQPVEHRIVCKCGRIRWVRNTMIPHYDDQRNLIAHHGAITDITEQRSASS